MSAMFDYITGKKSGREAELEASLEHMGGHLGVEMDDNGKLRAEIECLTAQVDGWKRTALAMRDAAIFWDRDGKNRYEEIERMYMDAALLGRWADVAK